MSTPAPIQDEVTAALAHRSSPIPASLQPQWNLWINAERAPAVRVMLALGSVLYLLFYFNDAAIHQDMSTASLMIRTSILALLGPLAVAVLFLVRSADTRDAVLMGGIACAGIGAMVPPLLLPSSSAVSTGYFASMLCFPVAISMLVSTRFSYAVAATAVVMAALLVALLKVHARSKIALLEFFTAFLPVALFCMQVCWLRLRDMRRTYLRIVIQELQMRQLDSANQRLHTQADTDALTGIANRRAFDRVLHDTIARLHSTPQGESVALLMLDIDYFKPYNDHYGHPQGDVCLRRVAHALRDALRSRDTLVFRFGGEEFAILATGLDGQHALNTLAARVLAAVTDMQLPHTARPDALGYITISAGACLVTAQDTQATPDTVLQCADQYLYQAKHAGRNRFISGPMQ